MAARRFAERPNTATVNRSELTIDSVIEKPLADNLAKSKSGLKWASADSECDSNKLMSAGFGNTQYARSVNQARPDENPLGDRASLATSSACRP